MSRTPPPDRDGTPPDDPDRRHLDKFGYGPDTGLPDLYPPLDAPTSACRLDDRTLLVPMRAEGPNGEIGDALVRITRDDGPDLYEQWAAWIDGDDDTPNR